MYNQWYDFFNWWGSPECLTSDEFPLLIYYYDLFATSFKYKQTPESVQSSMLDLKNLETWLWYQPAICFFEDDVLGPQVLPVSSRANFTVAFFPKEWGVYGANGYKKKGLNEKNSVLMFNDNTRVPPLLYVYRYVRRIVQLEKTADMNVDFQKTPYIAEIDEEQEKSIKKLFGKIDDFSKLIITRKRQKGGILEGLKVSPTKVNFEADKFLSLADKYEAKILSYLGINNVAIEKAERLITSEADSNNEKIYAQYTARYNCRAEAIEKANKMFGLNMRVEPNKLATMQAEDVAKETDNNPGSNDDKESGKNDMV